MSQGATKMHKKIDLRFWTVFLGIKGAKTEQGDIVFGTHLATIFNQKSQKGHQKSHAKIDVEKVSNNNAKSDQK